MSCAVIKVCASSKRKLFMVKPRRSKGEEKRSHSTKHCWGFGLVRRERRTGERRANQLVSVTRNPGFLGTWLWQHARWCEFGWRTGSRNGVYGGNCSGESISYRFRCQKPGLLVNNLSSDEVVTTDTGISRLHPSRSQTELKSTFCRIVLWAFYSSHLCQQQPLAIKKTLFFSLVRAIGVTVNYAKQRHFLF